MSGRGHSRGGAGGRGGARGRGRGRGQQRGGGRTPGSRGGSEPHQPGPPPTRQPPAEVAPRPGFPSSSSIAGPSTGPAARGGSAPHQPGPPPTRQPPAEVAPRPGFPSSSSIAGPSTGPAATSLAGEMERKMTIQAGPSQPPASQPRTPAPQPAPPSQETQVPAQPPPSSSKSVRPPARPGFGTVGTKCLVRANHFLVNVVDKDLHHYDVTITPEVNSKRVCREIVNQLATMYRASHLGNRQIAYDGSKSLYTPGALPFSSKEFVVKLVDNEESSRRDRQFKVAIKFAAKAELYQLQEFLRGRFMDSPQDTIQVLDVVLRSRPSNKYLVVGRSFFHRSLGESGSLGDGLEYYKGFYQSLRPTQMGLSLNVDVSARGFYEPILVSDFVAKYFNIRDIRRPLYDQDRLKVKKALKGVKVVVTHRQDVRRYKISGVSGIPTSQITFTDDTGRNVSIVQYFKERYNTIIRFGSLPALQAGSDSKPVYLPMELCRIVDGQRYTKKLQDKQVTALLRATCQRPHDREASICKMVRQNDYNSDEVARGFGVTIGAELTAIQARVLPAPMLQYEGSQEAPRVGAWNMIDKKMFNGARVESWTCVNFSRLRHNEASNFCDRLLNMCVRKGMQFCPTPLLPISSAHPGQIEKTLSDIHAESVERLRSQGHTGKHLQLLIIILPDVTGNYGRIKRVCETELGIVSQCCQPMHAVKCKEQYLENVALKINVKVGGRNSVLVNTAANLPFVIDTPTIIFGADVTHPQPGEDSGPSIAAVVASMDWPEVTKYRGLVSAQPHREEIIRDLYKTYDDPRRGRIHSGMIRDLLIAHFRSTNRKPARIIFYRDGVSEGQFNQVLLHEMDAIRQACVSLEERYLPRVTFVVVQKRHHTRLFPAQHGDRRSTDRSGNILPGTVVDRQICHPSQFDFYLCSHAGIMGTSRPTHYHVLYDENGFNANALQTLTNNLCYTYARCTRSVSIVPPAYYAHLAAFRARYYIEGDASDSGSSSRETDRNVAVRPLPSIKENVKDVMFYC